MEADSFAYRQRTAGGSRRQARNAVLSQSYAARPIAAAARRATLSRPIPGRTLPTSDARRAARAAPGFLAAASLPLDQRNGGSASPRAIRTRSEIAFHLHGSRAHHFEFAVSGLRCIQYRLLTADFQSCVPAFLII